jgi:hypothetical protein
MPDYFSHNILAEQIYEKLDKSQREQISDHTLYLLGAQGGDVFFMYYLKFAEKNLGVRFHHMVTLELFKELAAKNKSYAAGFATHYAADCTLHPAVYAFVNAHPSKFAHLSFENDLGLYCSRHYSSPRKILPKKDVVSKTFTIYDSIKNICDDVTLTGVERCLKRHFLYSKFMYKTRHTSYKYDYDFSSLNGALDDAVSLGCKAVKCVLSGDIDSDVFSKSFLEK